MVIYAVCRVQNEQDIIESLCRYYLQFCDGMIICDNFSQDNTSKILQQLVEEGLNIHLADKQLAVGVSIYVTNTLTAQMAFELFGADLVLPVDADEFLFSANGESPRLLLEKFRPDTEYQIPWRSYVYTQAPDDNTKFMPEFFPFRASKELPQFYKTAVSQELWLQRRCKFADGCHSLEFEIAPDRKNVAVEYTSDLFYAHYPIRSRIQAMRKSVIGALESIELPGIKRFKHSRGFNKVIKNGTLSDDDVTQYSLLYVCYDDVLHDEISLEENPAKLFLPSRPLNLRYTDYHLENETTVIMAVASKAQEIIEDLVLYGCHLGMSFMSDADRTKRIFERFVFYGANIPGIFHSEFCKLYPVVYIYGAGAIARQCFQSLEQQEESVSGFIVSDGQEKPESLFGVPVHYLSQVEANNNCGIIIALNDRNRAQVIEALDKRGFNYI